MVTTEVGYSQEDTRSTPRLGVSLTRPGTPLELGRATLKPHLGLGEGWSRWRVKSRGLCGMGTMRGSPTSLGCRIIFVQAFPVVGDSELIGYLLSSTPGLG